MSLDIPFHRAISRIAIPLLLLASGPSFGAPADETDLSKALAQVRSVRVEDADTILGFAAEGAALYDHDPVKLTGYQYCSQAVALGEGGEFRQSLRAASKALHLAITNNDPKLLASAERDLAIVMNYSGDLDKAETFARLAIGHADPHDRVVRGPALKTIADVQARRGDYAGAVKTYEQSADESSSRFRPLVVGSMVGALIGAGDLPRARAVLDATMQANKDVAYAAQFQRIRARLLLAEGRPDEALSQYLALLEPAGVFDGPYQRMWALEGAAQAKVALKDPRGAAQYVDQAISGLDDVRAQFRSDEIKFGLFSSMQSLFDEAIDLHLQLDEPGRALDISEKGRARSLLDAVRGRAAVPANSRATTAAELQALLAPTEQLLEFQVLNERLIVWIVTHDAVRTATLPIAQSELSLAVERFRQSIADARADTDELADGLGRRLIAPLQLPAGARLIVVPNGPLHYLPFQALRVDGRYLVERHPIAIVPSMQIGAQLLGRPLARRTPLVAFGNPSIAPRFDLPGAESEVRDIRRLFGDSTTFLRAEATKARFKQVAPHAGILHVAAHAQADTVDPLHSRILLANENGQTSFLEAHEVLGMDLSQVKLVTLSACESALGRIASGDEVLGFPRSFLSAGADAMIASLWPVSDESTSILMSTVYGQLKSGVDVQAAMQAAQLKVMHTPEMEHPFFWAPFNLIGNWRLTLEP